MQARLKQKSRSLNLKHASDDLRRDRRVVLTAALNHPGALVYCLDDALKAELTGLSRQQLNELLQTADEDMFPQLEVARLVTHHPQSWPAQTDAIHGIQMRQPNMHGVQCRRCPV